MHGAHAEPTLDLVGAPVELSFVDHIGPGMVPRVVGHGAEAAGLHLGQLLPRERGRALAGRVGALPVHLAVHQPRGQIDGEGQLPVAQQGPCVGEDVGKAIVEREHERRRAVTGLKPIQGGIEREHLAPLGHEQIDLRNELVDGEIELIGGASPDSVVGEQRGARRGLRVQPSEHPER